MTRLIGMAIFAVGTLFGWMTCALFAMNGDDDEDDRDFQG